MTDQQKKAVEEAAEKARIDNIVCLTGKAKEAFRMGAKEVIEHPERYNLTARKPLVEMEARSLVNQLKDEEISFSRFVELINEGGTK